MNNNNIYFFFFGGSGIPLILLVLVLTGAITLPGTLVCLLAIPALAPAAIGAARAITHGRIGPRRLTSWEKFELGRDDDLGFCYEDYFGDYAAPEMGFMLESRDLMLPEDENHFGDVF